MEDPVKHLDYIQNPNPKGSQKTIEFYYYGAEQDGRYAVPDPNPIKIDPGKKSSLLKWSIPEYPGHLKVDLALVDGADITDVKVAWFSDDSIPGGRAYKVNVNNAGWNPADPADGHTPPMGYIYSVLMGDATGGILVIGTVDIGED